MLREGKSYDFFPSQANGTNIAIIFYSVVFQYFPLSPFIPFFWYAAQKNATWITRKYPAAQFWENPITQPMKINVSWTCFAIKAIKSATHRILQVQVANISTLDHGGRLCSFIVNLDNIKTNSIW